MSKKTTHIILKYLGILIMLIAFLIVPQSKPWYYEVLLFDLGLALFLIPKLTKLKQKLLKIKAKM